MGLIFYQNQEECSQITLVRICFLGELKSTMTSNLTYYNYIDDGPKLLNENGWELMLVNLGYYPDNVTEITGGNTFDPMPYIVIYNRYTGVLRVFFNFGLDNTVGEGADAVDVMVSFKYSNKMSGLLRLNEGSDQSLDQNSDVRFVRSHAQAPAFGSQWASTDFQLAYDPCTCFYPSQLKIDFAQTQSSKIELQGRAVTLTGEPLVNNTTLQTNPTEFLSGYDFDGVEDAKGGGLVMHKALDGMIEDYLAKYEQYNKDLVAIGEHNAKVKKNLAILKMGLFVVKMIANPPAGVAIVTGALIAEKAAESANAELLGLTQAEIDEAYLNLGLQANGGWFGVIDKFYKGIVKSNADGAKTINEKALFEKVSQVFGEKGKTFIAQNFVVKKPPVKPAIPTATFTEMTYKGKITNHKDLGGPEFFTPGTYGSLGTGTPNVGQFYNYPVYNEILGTFALLENPKISIIEHTTNYSFEQFTETQSYNLGSSYDLDIYNKKNWTTEYQISLDEALLYTINPALDVTGYDISASYEIVATPKARPNGLPNYAIINAFSIASSCVNTVSENYDLSTNFPISTNGKPLNYYNTPIFYQPDFDSHLALPVTDYVLDNPNEDLQTVLLQSEYIPLDAFTPLTAAVGIHHQTATNSYNYIQDYYLDDYDHTVDANGNIIWDLSDPDFNLPEHLTLGYHGYEYDLKVTMKLLITIDYETLNSEDVPQPNSVTQLFTYPIDPEDITYTSIGAINNLYYSSSNVFQYEEDLIFGSQPANVGQPYEYKFYGQAVEGCTLDGNTYTCQAWNDVTIVGDIFIASGYDVNFYAGHEAYVVGNSMIPPTANLEIKPILDYSIPMPEAESDVVETFCQGNEEDAPAYQANLAEGKVLSNIAPEGELTFEADKTNIEWDFNLYPNPTHNSTTIKLIDTHQGTASVECFDMTMKRMTLVTSEDSSNQVTLSTEHLSPGVYIIKVTMDEGFKTKRLIVR
jgi:hypothetical protein